MLITRNYFYDIIVTQKVYEPEEEGEMAKAKRVKQLSFTIPNRAGLLSEISATVSGAKGNINAICAYEMGDNAYFMLSSFSSDKF